VTLEIDRAGTEPFTTGQASRNAVHYVLQVKLGGLTGLVAPLLGKQPSDAHVWILGRAPPSEPAWLEVR
jgi:hypothetical protein